MRIIYINFEITYRFKECLVITIRIFCTHKKNPRNFFSKINSINSSVIKSAYNAWERNVNENGFHGEWVVLDLIKMMLVLLKGNKWQSNRPPNRLNARQGWFRDKVEEIFDRRMVINE